MSRLLKPSLVIALLATPVVTPPALAQGAEAIEEVVVVGSRRQDRSAADSPVPVDVVTGEDFENQGASDMDDLLRNLVPSYNVSQQPISDAATLIRPANLRGMSADQTLVLVNGKRRHRASVISFLGGGLSDGAQGPDLSVIPAIAIERVEVLRDGASAQYGSDAIAGVMNFVLREDPDSGQIEARVGEYYEGDGTSKQIAGNVGFPLTDAGFANFSLQWKEADPTSRSVQRSDAQALIDAGNDNVRTPATQVWGAPEIKKDWTFFGNTGLDLGNGHEVYAFGNWSERTVEGGFFYRNPHTRPGVYSKDDGENILVANFDIINNTCPNQDASGAGAIPVVDNVPDAATLAAVEANPDCYTFYSDIPGGFTPFFGGTISDASIAGGVRGELENGWYWDLSAVVGRSRSKFFIGNTLNPQLIRDQGDIPREYRPGAYTELDKVFNFEMSRGLDVGALYSPLNFAWGLEYRDELFKLEPGNVGSFFIDPVDSNGDGVGDIAEQGFGIGSNGFPGFKPEDATEADRTSWAAWVDFEADLIEAFTLGLAFRYEDYDDFGDTFNGKLAARWQIVDAFALRGSVSTGFRAPTVGQSNVRNVTTEFQDGVLADSATLPPTDPISVQKGGVPLQPEESTNYTVGGIINFGNVNITVDYFNIKTKDRIAQTDSLSLTPEDIDALLAQGVRDATSFTSVKYFTNDFDTTTQGIDVVATTSTDWLNGQTNWSLLFNWTDTKVDDFNPDIISADKRVRQLEETIPDFRGSLTANHTMGDWRFLARVSYYDGYTEFFANELTWELNGKEKWLMDVEVAYTIGDMVTLVAGAQNLFDTTPTKQEDPAGRLGSVYGEASPFGYNGGFWYVRGIWNFRQ